MDRRLIAYYRELVDAHERGCQCCWCVGGRCPELAEARALLAYAGLSGGEGSALARQEE